MNRRHFALGAALASTSLLSGFGWDKQFDLSWEEEVLLHDGRVIVVKLKHTYERLHPGLTRYGGTNLTRDTTLTFNAGGTTGVVTQLFKGFHPMFIGQYQGVWYAVLYGTYYARSREIPGQDWGELEGPYGQWAIKLVEGKWVPISMSNLPDVFREPNMFMLYGVAEEHAAFDGTRMTLRDKQAWLAKHHLAKVHIRLTRPTSASPKRPDARNTTGGDAK